MIDISCDVSKSGQINYSREYEYNDSTCILDRLNEMGKHINYCLIGEDEHKINVHIVLIFIIIYEDNACIPMSKYCDF